jgi:hypothetical protein
MMYRMLVISTILALNVASADGAAMKATTFGCRAEADTLKAVTLQAKKDTAGLEAFVKPKIASGECASFARGTTVDPETSKPNLTCVRLTGGLDCEWVADYLVDLHPSDSRPTGAAAGGGHRRH